MAMIPLLLVRSHFISVELSTESEPVLPLYRPLPPSSLLLSTPPPLFLFSCLPLAPTDPLDPTAEPSSGLESPASGQRQWTIGSARATSHGSVAPRRDHRVEPIRRGTDFLGLVHRIHRELALCRFRRGGLVSCAIDGDMVSEPRFAPLQRTRLMWAHAATAPPSSMIILGQTHYSVLRSIFTSR